MPCRTDTWEERVPGPSASKKLAMLEASCCMLMRYLENFPGFEPTQLDFKEAGISKKEFIDWWKEHKAEDDARRKKEAERLRELVNRQRTATEAIGLLTPEQLEILEQAGIFSSNNYRSLLNQK